MNYKKRLIEAKILKFSKSFPVIVLNGARQVGKSTLLEHLFPTLRRVVFDPVIDVGNARLDPELFLSLNPPPIILDEIQYAPELVPVIKRLVDERPDEKGLFFITGSQQFSVIKSITESLAGRAALLTLETLGEKEITGQTETADFFIESIKQGRWPDDPMPAPPVTPLLTRIFKGGYPRTLEMDNETTTAWFESYLKTYVERDIRSLGNIDDLQLFSRFTRLSAQLTAQEINDSHLGREIGLDPKTARSWRSILKASYQWIELEAYSGNATKRLSEKPKGHFSDTGFACYLSSIFSAPSLSSHPLLGHLFETHAIGEVIRLLQLLPAAPALYHWRSHGGAEVDLVLEYNGLFWLIEAKLAARPTLKEARGIEAFQTTYPKNKIGGCLILSGGNDTYRLKKNTLVVPVSGI